MKNSLRLTLALVGIAFLFSCQQSAVNVEDEPDLVREGNYTFYSSENMYERLQDERPIASGTPFEIINVWDTKENSKKYLHVEVQHKKACDVQFKAVWNGRVAESYPPQIYLALALNAEECEDQENLKTNTLSLDLYELFGEQDVVDEAIFRISNSSSNQDVKYDESTSTS